MYVIHYGSNKILCPIQLPGSYSDRPSAFATCEGGAHIDVIACNLMPNLLNTRPHRSSLVRVCHVCLLCKNTTICKFIVKIVPYSRVKHLIRVNSKKQFNTLLWFHIFILFIRGFTSLSTLYRSCHNG